MRLLPLLLSAPLTSSLIDQPHKGATHPHKQWPSSVERDESIPFRTRPLAQKPLLMDELLHQAAAKKPAISRDFGRFPLKHHFEDRAVPAQFTVLSDTHAAANVIFPLLLNNGIISEQQPTWQPRQHCGGHLTNSWGEFRWSNPYIWNYGQNVLVSLGDRINKGSFNLITACFFMDLQQQAKLAGGEVILQWGNHEAASLESWNNPKSRGPGGILWELEAYGIHPASFFADDSLFASHLQRQPIVTQIGEQIIMVHGGVCPSARSLDADLAALEDGLKKEGFATDELQNENSLVRCRIHTGRDGTVTLGNTTEIVYGHDPEHEPRGNPYCYPATNVGQKKFTYCRTDVGMTPYINYSKGWLEKYTKTDLTFKREKCNELGSCADLVTRNQTNPFSRYLGTLDRPKNPSHMQQKKPSHSPHSGADRNFTSHPAIAVVKESHGDLFVLGDTFGALLSTKKILAASGLIANGSLAEPLRWTGGQAILVTTGNLFGAGYLNLENLDLFADLGQQAEKHGGRVYALLGAKEVDFLDDPNNDDTWAGGGIACQILGNNSQPDNFSSLENPTYRHMFNRPFGVRWQDVLILSGGQTSNRFWQDLADDLSEAVKLDGFGASLVSGENSVTKKINFAGRGGKQGPLLAKDAGVTSIIHGLDLAMEPVDEIKTYGVKDKTISLFNVASRINPSFGGGKGKILRVRRDGQHMLYDSFDHHGHKKRIATNPYNSNLSI